MLMVASMTVFAGGLFVGVEAGAGKVYNSKYINVSTGELLPKVDPADPDVYSTYRNELGDNSYSKSVEGKIGYKNEAASLNLFVGVDNSNNDVNYYGIEFDKNFESMYAGFRLGKGTSDDAPKFTEVGIKLGKHFEINEASTFNTGVKYTHRLYENVGEVNERDDVVAVFIGVDFNL